MDLHYLRIFYEVAKECSFTKAAHNLYINQSAVSIQVKKFEELLGTKLFDRSSKKIKLTYSGEVLYKMSEDIFQNRSNRSCAVNLSTRMKEDYSDLENQQYVAAQVKERYNI